MKQQIFDERHIGMPIIMIYPTGDIETGYLTKRQIELQNNFALTYSIKMDIDFIFRMLDADLERLELSKELIQYLYWDLTWGWRWSHIIPTNDYFPDRWALNPGHHGQFPFWPYPGDWRDSLIQRPQIGGSND